MLDCISKLGRRYLRENDAIVSVVPAPSQVVDGEVVGSSISRTDELGELRRGCGRALHASRLLPSVLHIRTAGAAGSLVRVVDRVTVNRGSRARSWLVSRPALAGVDAPVSVAAIGRVATVVLPGLVGPTIATTVVT